MALKTRRKNSPFCGEAQSLGQFFSAYLNHFSARRGPAQKLFSPTQRKLWKARNCTPVQNNFVSWVGGENEVPKLVRSKELKGMKNSSVRKSFFEKNFLSLFALLSTSSYILTTDLK